MSNFGGYLTLFHMVDLILTIFFLVLGLVIVMLLTETCTIWSITAGLVAKTTL